MGGGWSLLPVVRPQGIGNQAGHQGGLGLISRPFGGNLTKTDRGGPGRAFSFVY